jgi:hypothetical protein
MGELPVWTFTQAWRVAGGYRDNVEMSALRGRGSGFVRGVGDGLLLGTPHEALEVQVFASVMQTRYFSGALADPNEMLAAVDASGAWRFAADWALRGGLQFFHLNQYLDLSVNEAERLVAKLRSNVGEAELALRRVLAAGHVEGRAGWQRERYHDGSEDAVEPAARLETGWSPSGTVDLVMTVSGRWRRYDRRLQYSEAGVALPGTRLGFSQAEGTWEVRWRPDRLPGQCLNLIGVATSSVDNGSGFFDYDQRGVRLGWEGRLRDWRLSVQGRVARYVYPTRSRRAGGTAIWRNESSGADLRLERRLRDGWRLFAEAEWERSRASHALVGYQMKTFLLGCEWLPGAAGKVER